jgi:hypothetical protein
MYLQRARTSPAQIGQIQREVAGKVQEQFAGVQRAEALASFEPYLSRIVQRFPERAAELSFLANAFKQGRIKDEGEFLEAVKELQRPSDEVLGETLQRRLGPRAQPGAGRDLVTLRGAGMPIGLGDANVTGRAQGASQRQPIQDQISVLKRRLSDETQKATAAVKARPETSDFWTARLGSLEAQLKQAEEDLLDLGAGGGAEPEAIPSAPPPTAAAPGATGPLPANVQRLDEAMKQAAEELGRGGAVPTKQAVINRARQIIQGR